MPGVSALRQDQKDAIKNTWAPIKSDAKCSGTEFFKKLFDEYPYTEDFFPQFKGKGLDQLKDDKAMKAHGVTVVYAITALVDSLDDEETFDGLVRKIAQNHSKRSVGPAAFMNAFQVLISYVGIRLGDQFGKHAGDSWEEMVKIYKEVAEASVKKCNQDCDGK